VPGADPRLARALRRELRRLFSERSLHEAGAVDRALEALAGRGETYTTDGALWLRTSAHGDDKDRVLVRSSGEHTYFTSDIAYMQDKRSRGYDRLVYVWGADHHGYIARMKAACVALGADPDSLEIVISSSCTCSGSKGARRCPSARAST